MNIRNWFSREKQKDNAAPQKSVKSPAIPGSSLGQIIHPVSSSDLPLILQAEKKGPDYAQDHFFIRDFAAYFNSPEQIEPFFIEMASLFVRSVFSVNFYPFDFRQTLNEYGITIQNATAIREEKTMGAAIFALFCKIYLKDRLGTDKFPGLSPQEAILTLGEITAQGIILRSDNLAPKLESIINHYPNCNHIKAILPQGEVVPRDIATKFGNIFYVRTVEELLSAVCSPLKEDFQSLSSIKNALFGQLSRWEKNVLKSYLKPGIPSQIFDLPTTPKPVLMTNMQKTGSVYTSSKIWKNKMIINLSTKKRIVQQDHPNAETEEEAVFLVLDGSQQMNHYWTPKTEGGICRFSELLAKVLKILDPKNNKVYIGFLSDTEFIPISTSSAPKIDGEIRKHRNNKKLAHRGAYLRPVFEKLTSRFANQKKQVYLISDGFLPDAGDFENFHYFNYYWLQFSSVPKEGVEPYLSSRKLSFPEFKDLYNTNEGNFFSIQLEIPKGIPIFWSPNDGDLIQENESLYLKWDDLQTNHLEACIRFGHESPDYVEISGSINREVGTEPFSFTNYPVSEELIDNEDDKLALGLNGHLTAEEFQQWKTLTNEGGDIHLLKDDPYVIRSYKPIFESVPELSSGYFLLKKDDQEWHFFHSGYQIDGISFVELNGTLHWAYSGAFLKEVDYYKGLDNVYYANTNNGIFYLSKI